MAWTYDPKNIKRLPAPPTLDYWRYKIGDTIESDPILSNEEIMAIALLENNDETLVVYSLLEGAINAYSSKTGQMWTSRKLGPQSESRSADTRLKVLRQKLDDMKTEMASRWIIVKRRERNKHGGDGDCHGV